ncbi:MAG: hypothetical protein NTW75_05860 [Planctomycetales bacterium]|nr:hypothetical protein [Planctomycetales bacterium]
MFLLNDDLLDDVSVGLAKPVKSDFESGDVDQRIVFLYDITFPHNPSSGGIGAGNEGVSIPAEEDFWRHYSRPFPRTSALIDVDGRWWYARWNGSRSDRRFWQGRHGESGSR